MYGGNFTVNGELVPDVPIRAARRRHVPARAVPRRQPVPRLRSSATPGTVGRRRAERDGGFLAPGAERHLRPRLLRGRGPPDVPALARRFLVFDDWHASLLGPTYPNREYLLSAQSGGNEERTTPAGRTDGSSGTRSSTASHGRRLRRPTTTPTSRRWRCRAADGSARPQRSRTTTKTPKPGGLPSVTFVDPRLVVASPAPTTIRSATRAPRSTSSRTCSPSFVKLAAMAERCCSC